MNRRALITLLGGAAAVRPLAARTQQLELPRIGVLRVAGAIHQPAIEGLRQGLRDLHGCGLMSYGPSLPDVYRRFAALVDKILQGAGPADLQVEVPTRFALIINLKAAKAIDLTIPESLLLRDRRGYRVKRREFITLLGGAAAAAWAAHTGCAGADAARDWVSE
jgi:hypothetical protein